MTALIRPFVPARDFAGSLSFYEALGFVVLYRDDELAILEQDGAGILLQDYYVEAFARNCMYQLFVADLDAWWSRTHDLAERFGVSAPVAPAMQPYGIRVGFVRDPSDVLWHIAEP